MGALEQKNKRNIRKTKINKAVLGVLALSGALAVGLLAPNVIGALGRLGVLRSQKQAVTRSLDRLVAQGYVRRDKGKIRLTQKGEILAALFGDGKLTPRKKKRWDGKWRILIFDIPEPQRTSLQTA